MKKLPNQTPFFIEATNETIVRKLAEYGLRPSGKPDPFYVRDEEHIRFKYELFMHTQAGGRKGFMVHYSHSVNLIKII